MRRDVFLLFRVSSLSLSLLSKEQKHMVRFNIRCRRDGQFRDGRMPIEIVRWSDGGFDGGRGQAAQHRCPCFASKPTHTLPPKKIPTWNSLYFLHISVDPFESLRSKGWGVEELTFTKFPKRKSTVNLISALSLFQNNNDLVFWQRNWEHKTIAASDWLPRGRGVKGVWQKLAVH